MPSPAMAGTGSRRGASRRCPAIRHRLAEVLSMGQNGRWRRAMVDRIAGPWTSGPDQAAGADVASGTAGVALAAAWAANPGPG